MFDGDPNTYWHGPATVQNTVTINFINPIMFHALILSTRHDQIYQEEPSRNICLYVDDVEEVCTSSNRQTRTNEKIILIATTPKTATKIALWYKNLEGAVIAELKISYAPLSGK